MSLQGKFAYLLLMPALPALALIFIMIKIVPQFVKIFQDFGTDLPAMTVALIGTAHWFGMLLVLFAPS